MQRILCFAAVSVLIFGIVSGCVFSTAAEAAFPDASEDPKLRLKIELFDSPEAYAQVLELSGYADCPYVLFLPASCDRSRLRAVFDAPELAVDGIALRSGDVTDVFSEDGVHTVVTQDGEYRLRVVTSAELPSVFITTESGSLSAIHADKAFREPGYISVSQQGTLTLSHAGLTFIKGHGNSSWLSGEKRSYTIKFRQKTSFLGMGEARKWVLVSNTMDPTLLRNAAAFTAAKQTSIPYTVDFAFVDLYINGNYRGNYLVCEKAEIGKNRVAIEDLEEENEAVNPDLTLSEAPQVKDYKKYPMRAWCDIPNSPSDISGGYLMEYDYPEELDIRSSAFLTKYGSCLVLREPEYATKQEVEYVSTTYTAFEEALLAKDGKNREGRHYSEYIDADSFADGILLYELAKDQDRGYSSWYIFLPKKPNVFYMGPIWDNDQAFENPDDCLQCIRALAKREYDDLSAAKRSGNITFIDLLCSHRDFTDLLAKRYFELESAFSSLSGQVRQMKSRNAASAQADAVRWGIRNSRDDHDIETYLKARIRKMHDTFSDPDAQVAQELQRIRAEKGYETDERVWPQEKTSVIPVCAAAVVCVGIVVLAVIGLRKKERRHRLRHGDGQAL